jgi:hypothetical protein
MQTPTRIEERLAEIGRRIDPLHGSTQAGASEGTIGIWRRALGVRSASEQSERESRGLPSFRFDLAATLGRGAADFDPHAAFLRAIGQDPVLNEVKLIAEPWPSPRPWASTSC